MGEEEVEDPSVTRVYISGLPPSITKDQLWSHFATKCPVTDAHVVSDRRIGFVGFPSHESAKIAAKYFNKSFIRMSKISVSLAKPVEVKRDPLGQAAPVSRRSFRHQGGHGQAQDIYSRKRKRDIRDDGDRTVELSKDLQEKARNTRIPDRSSKVRGPDEDMAAEEEQAAKDSQEIAEVDVLKSDTDWLRGKTSRLLDLVDDESSEPQILSHAHAEVKDSSVVATDAHEHEKTENHRAANLEAVSIPNARLFLRNLPFDAQEESLRDTFSSYGRISEVHLIMDTKTSTGKGLGYIQFVEPKDAEKAMVELDGKAFQGRLMHILPASDKKTAKLSEFELSKLPLKKQRAIKRKHDASTLTFSWNSLYMNPDAVLASVAERLGVSKAELLDPTSADAAVKQAHAETSVIKETKEYLKSNGVNIDAFKSRGRDERTLLLKNFSFGTTSEELSQMLSQYGSIERLIFPPTGTMAVVQYYESSGASLAMKQLAYRNLRGAVLYLEKAPKGLWDGPASEGATATENALTTNQEGKTAESTATSATVFVRNLNFSTTTLRLTEAFKPLSGFLSARVKTRTDPSKPGQVLSMGFGFVEFRTISQAEAAIATMNGRLLDGHELLVQSSRKSADVAEERRKEDKSNKLNAKKTKIIIKNLPFEATKKDVRALFSTYGQLRTVRLPRKFDNSARGFAFAEFVTAKEAENAMEALSNTHLLGRRLVLDFAEGEIVDPEAEIRAMEKKIQSHQDTLAHHRMTGSARKKFNVDAQDDRDPL